MALFLLFICGELAMLMFMLDEDRTFWFFRFWNFVL